MLYCVLYVLSTTLTLHYDQTLGDLEECSRRGKIIMCKATIRSQQFIFSTVCNPSPDCSRAPPVLAHHRFPILSSVAVLEYKEYVPNIQQVMPCVARRETEYHNLVFLEYWMLQTGEMWSNRDKDQLGCRVELHLTVLRNLWLKIHDSIHNFLLNRLTQTTQRDRQWYED